MGIARRVGFGGYRIFYIYGGAVMTDFEKLQGNEKDFYENVCKKCVHFNGCWILLQGVTCYDESTDEKTD